MKEELKIFLTALMFYTRIPCPKNINHSEEYINKASRYFPLIGYIVGGISFLVYYCFSLIFSLEISILMSIISGILITGGFHEDGLADTFDGFGGGWEKEKILFIMKDSNTGAFGVLSLILSLALKFFSLIFVTEIFLDTINEKIFIFLLFISYHSFARLVSVNLIFVSNYSEMDQKTKIKPIVKTFSITEVISSYGFGLIPLIIFSYFYPFIFLILVIGFFIVFFSKRYFEKWIQGYTGDCLGAIEQIAEVSTILFIGLVCGYM